MKEKILLTNLTRALKSDFDMDNIIEIKNLKKYYRYGIRGYVIRALDDISFSVGEGEVFGMIGPNGAGKSTTIKILLGLIKQNAGECLIFGKPLSNETKKQIGYLPENPYFYKYLTGLELVSFYARLCGMTYSQAKMASEKALDIVGLSDAMNRPLSLYSKGMVQRAGLAQAIVHDPKLVILDEPASGLDPIGAEAMAKIITHLKESGKTILLCSHMMSEVERLCSRTAILCSGKIVALGEINKLLEIDGTTQLDIEGVDDSALEKITAYAQSLGAKAIKKTSAKISLDEFFRKTIEGNK